jgi:magnesium transporter
MSMIVKSAAYEQGRRTVDVGIDELDQVPTGPGRFIWIGLHEPNQELLRKVQAAFRLHDLAIEDALRAHQRPKLEVYGDALFMVVRTAQLEQKRIVFGETHIFAGRGYVVTVRHGPSLSYSEVRSRCEALPDELRRGEDFVIYAILDFIVDHYMPIVEELEANVEEIERKLFAGSVEPEIIEQIYQGRRDLLELRRCVAPLSEICSRVMRADVPVVKEDTYPYFRDVADHAIRVNESIDSLRELLSSALEVNLLLASFRQSEVMKKLAGWAAILAVPTAVAGVYGMNFSYMPELQWTFGYPLVLTGIIGFCVFLFYRFRQAGWL